MEYKLDFKNGMFEIKATGSGDVKAIQSYISELLEHEQWAPGSKILIDYSDCNLGNITVNEVYEIISGLEQVRDLLGNSKCAHVVARDIEYGMIRMWEAMVENKWNVSEKLFRSRDDALAWIGDK